jgi:hypothetical protein
LHEKFLPPKVIHTCIKHFLSQQSMVNSSQLKFNQQNILYEWILFSMP